MSETQFHLDAEDKPKAGMAVVLAGIAGYVDAIGYLVLLNLFTAHMSGNSVALGVYLGRREWLEALRRGIPIPLFMSGVACGGAVAETSLRTGVKSLYAPALTIEWLLLVAFMVVGRTDFANGTVLTEPAWKYYLLVGLPAFAMGVQSAALRRLGGKTIQTVFITGLLTTFTEELISCWLRGSDGHRARHLIPAPSRKRTVLLGGIYLTYVFGAVAGGALEVHYQLSSLLVPIFALTILIINDLVRPINPPPSN